MTGQINIKKGRPSTVFTEWRTKRLDRDESHAVKPLLSAVERLLFNFEMRVIKGLCWAL